MRVLETRTSVTYEGEKLHDIAFKLTNLLSLTKLRGTGQHEVRENIEFRSENVTIESRLDQASCS